LYCEGVEDEMEAVDTEGGNVEKEESLDGKGGLTGGNELRKK